MDTKQPLSLFLVAILAASVFTVVGITSIPLQKASAQAVTIETSADALGDTFFGHGAIQVIIEDDNTDDDSDDTISVEIEADSSDGTDVTKDFDIINTNDGSQRFEFFLVHFNSTLYNEVDLDAINVDGAVIDADGDDVFSDEVPATGAPVISFGTSDALSNLGTGDNLFDDITFTISYGNQEVTINYEEVPADLSLDRETEYGSTSTVHIFIDDQDGNINPTEADTFELTDAQLTDAAGADTGLFIIDGAAFDTTTLIFEETGDNTGIFEGIVSLNNTAAADDELDPSEDTIQLTLNDQANYDDTLTDSAGALIDIDDPEINDSTDTSEVTLEIDDSDGEVDDVTDPTFSSELKVTVRDDDQNIDSDDDDTISDALVVESNGDTEEVDLEETGDNTGVFEFDLSNSELRLTFLSDGATPTDNNGILEFNAEDIDEDIVISYVDPLDDDSTPNTVTEFTVALTVTPGQLAAPEEVGVTDEFPVTLTDTDLNDNPRTRDAYSFQLDDTSPFPLLRGGLVFGDIYTFEIEHDGDVLDFGPFGAAGGSNVTISVTETGINTGIFEFDIDMEDITDFGDGGDPLEVSDGDDITINIEDFMADTADPDEDDVSITIGKPSVGLDFSRTTVPIPPEDGSETAAGPGDTVVIQMILVDPTLATQTNVEEIVDFEFGTDEGQFTIEVDGDDVNSFTVDEEGGVAGPAGTFLGDTAGCAGDGSDDEAEIVEGVSLCAVLTVEDLEETGKATGVFEADLEFTMDGVDPDDMSAGDWQDAEFTFTYTNDEGDEESSGFTFRGNDGIVTVDQPSVTTGTVLVITVEDQDLNLDDNEMESFSSGDLDGAGPLDALVLVETEDEEVPGIDEQDFEETGEDTGVFTAEFEVGDDIPISFLDEDVVEQATNILITYDDEIDSTGGGGDELEVNVPVVSSTGSIQVTPDLVGPATTLTILIVDSDLDEDSASTDDYESTDPTGDDFFVSFTSSRNEVGDGSPDIEETGPNTGVFMFELELITDEEACQDDDLDTAEFEATGGDTDSTIGACPGDLISVRYEDERTAGGGRATVSEVIEVMSWDPEFVADKDSYSVGDRVTVTISDPDANQDSDIADSLTDIRVTSDSDRVGEEFSAIETGRDTGVFRLTFGTSAGTAAGSISVKQGDDVTVRYTDEFPADFVDQEEDKDFEFVVPIGGTTGTDTTTVTSPALQDVTGRTIDEVSSGQQVVLATSVRNNNDASQPFVALIEVRDDTDVTVFLAWQTGTLPANGQTNVGLSWTPDISGDYQVRTFVISDLNKPQVLSKVSTTDITVN